MRWFVPLSLRRQPINKVRLSEDNCAAELTTTRTVQVEVWEDGADIRADMGTNVCLNPWHSLSLVMLTAPSVTVGAAEH